MWLRRWLRIPGADRDLADWNARMRKPHHATTILITPQALRKERESNMTAPQRMKANCVRSR